MNVQNKKMGKICRWWCVCAIALSQAGAPSTDGDRKANMLALRRVISAACAHPVVAADAPAIFGPCVGVYCGVGWPVGWPPLGRLEGEAGPGVDCPLLGTPKYLRPVPRRTTHARTAGGVRSVHTTKTGEGENARRRWSVRLQLRPTSGAITPPPISPPGLCLPVRAYVHVPILPKLAGHRRAGGLGPARALSHC